MRAIHFIPVVAVVFALAACGDKEPEAPKTAEEVATEAAKIDRPDPGQYRTTVTIKEFDIPGAPPQVADQMKQMMGSQQSHSMEYCVTDEEAEKGFKDMLKKSQDGDCTFEKFDADSNSIDAAMTCKTPNEGTAKMVMQGTTSSTGMTMDMTMDGEMAQMPGGKMHMKMQMVSERIGDCPKG